MISNNLKKATSCNFINRLDRWNRNYSHDMNFLLHNSAKSAKSQLTVLNSLSGKKEPFEGLNLKKALTWYTCGPTVYDQAHLGHGRNYLSLDIVQRILVDYFGYEIIHVMGITDVDDKIIKKAKELSKPSTELVEEFESSFLRDMNLLNIRPPILYARVTEHIDEILKYVERIIDNGYAYQLSDGSVYFDVTKMGPSYWKLRNGEKLAVEDEINSSSLLLKKNAKDFALWKSTSDEGLHDEKLSWKSPWCAKGRPGWHIECSAMSRKYFGDHIDVHWGGIDLAFPHHNNEIAQDYGYRKISSNSENSKWVNYFLHCGHLNIEGRKMSKSLKNFVTISEFLRNNSAEQLRLFCANHRYNSNISFCVDRVGDASNQMEKFLTFFLNVKKIASNSKPIIWTLREHEFFQKFQDLKSTVHMALCDDFDTPRVIKTLLDFVKLGNIYMISNDFTPCPLLLNATFQYISKILSIFGFEFHQVTQSHSHTGRSDVLNVLATFRSQVRSLAIEEKKKTKNIAYSNLLNLCDKVRGDLQELDVVLSDLPNDNFSVFDLRK